MQSHQLAPGGQRLVLNKLFMAVHVITVRRAFCLLCKELAEVVSLEDGQFATYNFQTCARSANIGPRTSAQEDDDWVRTSNSADPGAARHSSVGLRKLPKQTVKFNRRNIFARDNNQCQYCGRKFPTSELSLDHMIPRSQGGTSTWENIVCACVKLQRPQGWPNSEASPHGPDPQAGEAEAQPAART